MNILAQFKNNFNGFLKVSLKEGTNALLQTISGLLETYDKELAALRNKDIYKLIKRVPRTILTTSGPIYFYRRYYYNIKTNNYCYLLDATLKIPKYSRLSDELKIKLVNSLTELSYRTAGKLIPPNGHTLSPATVFNILNKSSIKVWYKLFTKVNKTIHVQIDEKYVSTRSNKYNSSKRRIYTGCLFNDIDTSSSRHRLVDRTIASSRSQSDFFRKLNLTLKNQYNVKLSDKIYISGDLATYIQNSNEKIQVCSACYVPDKFHVTKLFLKFFGVKLTDSLDSFIKDVPIYIKTLLEMPESIKSSTDYTTLLNLLIKNPTSVLNWKNKDYLGCSQECINSHYFADRLAKKPNTFTTKSLDKLCDLLNAQHNGFKYDISFKENYYDEEDYSKYMLVENYYLIDERPIIDFSTYKIGLRTLLKKISGL